MIDRRAQIEHSAVWAARVGVAVTFLVASTSKVGDVASFAEAIASFQAFPYWSWNLLAAIVPMLELVGALALLSGWKRRAGALVLGVLTLGFIVLTVSVMVRGIDVSCGCFGRPDTASATGWPELVRNLLLVLGIALAAREPRAATA